MRATATTLTLRLLPLAVAAGLAWTTGCAQMNFDLNRAIPWLPDAETKTPSTRVVALWSDAVLNRGDQPPVRGFGGRLMFYGAKSEKPVKVQGTLTVYAFDEQGRDPLNTKPDRKFVITQEQLAQHYSKTKVGDSYSVWIPWDEVGGPQKEISLIVRFNASDGSVVVGEQTKHTLPGRPLAEAEARRDAAPRPAGDAADSAVRQVSYEKGVNDEHPRGRTDRPRMRVATTTIPVPPQFGRTCPVAEASPRAISRQKPTAEPAAAAPPASSPPPGSPQNSAAGEQASPKPAAALPAVAAPTAASTRFSPGRSRPLGEPIARLERDHALWQQYPAGSRSRPEPTPAETNGTESGSSSPGARSAVN